MLRSSTVLALVGTAAAADTYPTDEVACKFLGRMMQCTTMPNCPGNCGLCVDTGRDGVHRDRRLPMEF